MTLASSRAMARNTSSLDSGPNLSVGLPLLDASSALPLPLPLPRRMRAMWSASAFSALDSTLPPLLVVGLRRRPNPLGTWCILWWTMEGLIVVFVIVREVNLNVYASTVPEAVDREANQQRVR